MTGIRGLGPATLKNGPVRPSMDPKFDAPGARADPGRGGPGGPPNANAMR